MSARRASVQPPSPGEWELVEYGWNPTNGSARFRYEREVQTFEDGGIVTTIEHYETESFQPVFAGEHVQQHGLLGDPFGRATW